MKPDRNTTSIAIAIALSLGLPLVFYLLGDAPRRSLLKEAISMLTLFAFAVMPAQFFLARSFPRAQRVAGARRLQSLHKAIAYAALSVLMLHPLLIVLPRYFEGGVRPLDALITMITTIDNLGVLMGLAAWVLMVVLATTAWFRMRLIKRHGVRYRGWRYFHGALAAAFLGAALWHSVALGRHTGAAFATYLIVFSAVGISLLARLYISDSPRPERQRKTPQHEEART